MATNWQGPRAGRIRRQQMRRAVLVGLLLSCLACVSGTRTENTDLDAVMKSWMNSSMSDLIASWGPPDQETAVENGGKVLTYFRVLWMEADPLPCDDLYPTTDPTRAQMACNQRRLHERPVKGAQMFWANADGILYRWSWKVTG